VFSPLLAVLFLASVDLGFECPPALAANDGTSLPLVERPDGVWRVGEAVPFIQGGGRFWRFLCAYEAADRSVVETALYWAERPHDDGRPIVTGSCGEGSEDPRVLLSSRRQARVRLADPASEAQRQLGLDMLAAAEAVALPCPGTDDEPICPRWEVDEIHIRRAPDGHEQEIVVKCVWRHRIEEPLDRRRYIYDAECHIEESAWRRHGPVRRVAVGLWEREYWTRSPGGHAMTYRGDFSENEVRGRGHLRGPEGLLGDEFDFVGRCREASDKSGL
jgi:hypothetical protein